MTKVFEQKLSMCKFCTYSKNAKAGLRLLAPTSRAQWGCHLQLSVFFRINQELSHRNLLKMGQNRIFLVKIRLSVYNYRNVKKTTKTSKKEYQQTGG